MTDYMPNTGQVRNAYGAHMGDCHKVTSTALEEFDRWHADEIRKAKAEAWHEGFNAGWTECKDPDAFVNDPWDAKTPNPYTEES